MAAQLESQHRGRGASVMIPRNMRQLAESSVPGNIGNLSSPALERQATGRLFVASCLSPRLAIIAV